MIWFANLTFKNSFFLGRKNSDFYSYYYDYFTNDMLCRWFYTTEEDQRERSDGKKWLLSFWPLPPSNPNPRKAPPTTAEDPTVTREGWRFDWRLKVSYSFKQTSDRALFFVLRERVRAGEVSGPRRQRGGRMGATRWAGLPCCGRPRWAGTRRRPAPWRSWCRASGCKRRNPGSSRQAEDGNKDAKTQLQYLQRL